MCDLIACSDHVRGEALQALLLLLNVQKTSYLALFRGCLVHEK
jgi:hypothetical protein